MGFDKRPWPEWNGRIGNSGDQAVATESAQLLGPGLKTVVVKTAVSREAARSLSPDEARRRIREAAQQMVSALGQGRAGLTPFVVKPPVKLEVDFRVTVEADLAGMMPGASRTGARTVAYQHADYREVFRAFRTMFNLASE